MISRHLFHSRSQAASSWIRASREYGAAAIPGLHVPLAVTVDVLGFRVLAVAAVPATNAVKKTNSSFEGAWGGLTASQSVHAVLPCLCKQLVRRVLMHVLRSVVYADVVTSLSSPSAHTHMNAHAYS